MKATVKADKLEALEPKLPLPLRCSMLDILYLVKARPTLFGWEYKK